MWEGHWRRDREGTVGKGMGKGHLREGGRGWILARSVVGQQTVARSVVSQQIVARPMKHTLPSKSCKQPS